MIQGIYTVYDKVSQSFMALQLNRNHEVAIRNFDYAMRSNELMAFRPSDFELVYLGDYDDETGVITHKDHATLKVGSRNGKK